MATSAALVLPQGPFLQAPIASVLGAGSDGATTFLLVELDSIDPTRTVTLFGTPFTVYI
jgi:hypothetical protein